MIVRFGLDDDIYGKIYILDDGTLGYIGNVPKLEELARTFMAGFQTTASLDNPSLLARMLDRLHDKAPGQVWAEAVEPGPNALRHPMTEYLIRTGKLHPDYFDDYFTC